MHSILMLGYFLASFQSQLMPTHARHHEIGKHQADRGSVLIASLERCFASLFASRTM